MDNPDRPKFQTFEVDNAGNQSPVTVEPPPVAPQQPLPATDPQTPTTSPRFSVEEVKEPEATPVVEGAPPKEEGGVAVSKPNSWHRFLFVVPAVLLVVTMVVVGAVASARIGVSPTESPSPTIAPTLIPATPIPTPKPVLRLKNYTNPALTLNLKYPETLTLIECTDGLHFVSAQNSFSSDSFCATGSKGLISIETASQEYPIGGVEGVIETVREIDGVDAIHQTVKETAPGLEFSQRATFEYLGRYYLATLYSRDYATQFDSILESITFIKENPTTTWETYTNTTYGYSLKYPPEWTLEAGAAPSSAKQIVVAKDADIKSTQVVTVVADKDVSDAQINAQEVVSSTKSLSGWVSTPSVDVRQIGGGTAQVIQGQLNGNWQEYIVIWYRNKVVQLTWVDSPERGDQETFDYILSTFKFN